MERFYFSVLLGNREEAFAVHRSPFNGAVRTSWRGVALSTEQVYIRISA
jgi:hypothetical protein